MTKAADGLLKEVKEKGSTRGMLDRMFSHGVLFEIFDFPKWAELEKRFPKTQDLQTRDNKEKTLNRRRFGEKEGRFGNRPGIVGQERKKAIYSVGRTRTFTYFSGSLSR